MSKPAEGDAPAVVGRERFDLDTSPYAADATTTTATTTAVTKATTA
jgi:hypothetical protein